MSDEISGLQQKRLDTLVRHIDNVRENCILLGERLAERGEVDLGRRLIANGFIHDNSKFGGIEWLYLHQDVKDTEPEKFWLAAQQHVTMNYHHIEAWGGDYKQMPRVYRAELACDITARSQEFGNNVREWFKDVALPKYKFSTSCNFYKEVKGLLDLLLDKPFK